MYHTYHTYLCNITVLTLDTSVPRGAEGTWESDTNKQEIHYSNKIKSKHGIPCVKYHSLKSST